MPLGEQLQGDNPLPSGIKSTRVHVGRHEILIRKWPHPDPLQTLVAHRLMDIVQHEQRHSYGLIHRRQLIVITPTYVRTFQGLHLTCLIHTLRIAPSPLIWIVVEAGGVSNETATLLSSSQLSFYHLGSQAAMPADWGERQRLESCLRIEGLRFVREKRLDGLVIFADDSNAYSLDFFDEVQKVNWIGAFSIGVLSHSSLSGALKEEMVVTQAYENENRTSSQPQPLQGPVCNSMGHLIGWYAPEKDGEMVGPARNLEWAVFAINARLLWEEHEKPTWIRNWNEVFGGGDTLVQSPLDFVKNASRVQPLGNCGRDVLMWWLRVEARADSKFPSRWVISPNLDIVVPSKRTPWPDPLVGHPPPPPMLLSSDTSNHSEKHGSNQGARDGKRNQESYQADNKKQSLAHGKLEMQQASQIMGNTRES